MNHNEFKMRRSERQITDPEIIKAMLDICPIGTLGIKDEPYPYEVPLNFGYRWEEKLTIYLHMASEGYKMNLLKKDPYVVCNMYAFVDRSNAEKYKGEHQDYRSVTVFGKAEFVTCEDPEFLTGLNALQAHYKRMPIPKAPNTDKLYVVKIEADAVTAKAMYPLADSSEAEMPTCE